MATKLNPYISFRDNAREAMEFYETVFGGRLEIRTFKDFNAVREPEDENLVMHAVLYAANGFEFMASDTPKRMEYSPGNNISLSLSGEDEAELTGYFNKLVDGGTVTMPLEKAMWGDTFGMLKDKFGINWFVNISGGTPPKP